MAPYLFLFILLALLVGLAAGKAWERYKLQDGRWIDRRRARESPHYMLGLNFLVASQIDPAIGVLLSSGYSIDSQAREILARGCDEFIQKPYTLTAFSRKLRTVIGRRARR